MVDNKTFLISYPRSGHHLLVDSLLKYYGNSFKGRSWEVITKRAGKLCYCPESGIARRSNFNCINKDVNLKKDHDLNLDLEIDPKYKYIVLYRHPFKSIISSFFIGKNKYGDKLSREDFFTHFLPIKLKYWRGFTYKWVRDDSDHKMHITYVNLVDDFEDTVKKVVQFLQSEEEIDEERIKKVHVNMDVRRRKDIRDFDFYDEERFRELEKPLLDDFKRLNITPLFR